MNNHFELYNTFKSGLKYAKKHGLEAEYIQWLFLNLKVTKEQLEQAANGALLEWDM